MAVRKSAWDLSRNEIDARAAKLRVDAYLRAQPQQARADSISEAEREALRTTARNMTPDQIMAYSRAVERGENPSVIDYVSTVRADSSAVTGGLRMKTTLDDANRPIREFELMPGQTKSSTWMAPFMASPQEQMFINNKVLDAAERKTLQNKILADRAFKEQIARDLAAGKDVRFAGFESGERLS